MSSPWSSQQTTPSMSQDTDLDKAEKGLYLSSAETLPTSPPLAAVIDYKSSQSPLSRVRSPVSPIHEGLTPLSSVPALSLTKFPAQQEKQPTEQRKEVSKAVSKPKPKVSRWILLRLWFNTYRQFFILVTLLNLTGIIMAGLGRFPYAVEHSGAMVLGNLLFAVLMRNELFLRFLYMIAIYGLRWVSPLLEATMMIGM